MDGGMASQDAPFDDILASILGGLVDEEDEDDEDPNDPLSKVDLIQTIPDLLREFGNQQPAVLNQVGTRMPPNQQSNLQALLNGQ